MTYLRLYRSAIIAAIITILVLVSIPSALSSLTTFLPQGAGSFVLEHSSTVGLGVQVLIFIVGALVVWMLVRAQEDTMIEAEMDESEIDIYRQIRDSGIAPTLAQQVVDTNTNMNEDARTRDWQQANQPSFAAELGARLGVDGETRKMMREFFLNSGAETDMRRTFSTSLEVTLENGNIHKSHSTDAVIEPVSRFSPVDPEHDPHWTGDIAPELVKAKIFSDWNEAPVAIETNSTAAPEPTAEASDDDTADEPGDNSTDHESSDDEEEDEAEGTEAEVAAEDTVDTETEVIAGDEPDLQDWASEPDAPEDVPTNIALAGDGPYLVEADDEEAEQDQPEVDVSESQEALFPQVDEIASPEPTTEQSTLSVGDELEDDAGAEGDEASQDEAAQDVVDAETEATAAEEASEDEAAEIDAETDALYDSVASDPVFVGLIESMKLTRRLNTTDNMRYVYAYYGSDQPLLVTELIEPLVAHVDRFPPTVVPLVVQAGVRRCSTTAWVVDISSSASREADLSAIVWVPVGITRLGDAGNHTAWRLVPVASGSKRIFHVQQEHAALAAIRLELALAAVYDGCEVGWAESSMFFTVAGLGVTIELAVDDTLELTDEDIHADDNYVQGPESPTIYNVPLLADMARTWISERLGEPNLEVSDWLPLVNMITTLIMRVEPVPSRDLLGQWATPDSARGKNLIGKLEHIFGDGLSGDASGWVLSNVRCDVFWIAELLALEGDGADIIGPLTNFVVNTFRPGYSQSLLSLSALDPRMRSTDGIRLEQIITDVLGETLDLLSPGADGVLREHLNVIAVMLGRTP
ncbi:MAG: prolipoprotein diacylglyceryl transferase [Ferrimicrobium acidiphilum]